MNTSPLPPRREVKIAARGWMSHPVCTRVTLLLVAVSLGLYALRITMGGVIPYGLMDLSEYADTQSGIFFNDNGLSIIFRMDLSQMVLAIPLPYTTIAAFFILNAICFVILSPLRMGAMEQYWQVLRGGPAKVRNAFFWFQDRKRLGKALVVEFVLYPLMRLLLLLALLPSIGLFYLFYSSFTTAEALTSSGSLLHLFASLLAILAGLLAFRVHSVLLPIRYCLAAHPEYTLKQTFQRGYQSARGVRGGFFQFRLSFLLWFLLSQLTYGAMDIFVTPYSSLGGMIYLQEAARLRQAKEMLDEQTILPPR